LERRLALEEPSLKYRLRVGARKERKIISAPLESRLAMVYTCNWDNSGNLPEHGERQPQEEDKLEDKVEREPVNNVEEALDHAEESENNPVLQRISGEALVILCRKSSRAAKRNIRSATACHHPCCR
jgi:hypothetical protein